MSTYGFLDVAGRLMGRRPLADSIDDSITWGALIAVSVVASPAVRVLYSLQPVAGIAAGVTAMTAMLLSSSVAFALCLARRNGQTPGLRAAGLRVVCVDGAPLTFWRAVKCEIVTRVLVPLRWVLSLGIIFWLDALRDATHPDEPRWQDQVSRTKVVPA